jgi:hypothetical protein
MTSLATHVSVFLRERLPLEKRASERTCEVYALTLRLFFEFAAQELKIRPSSLRVAGGEEAYGRWRHIFWIGKGPVWALLFFKLTASERLIVAFGAGVVGVVICVGVQMLLAADFEQLDAVVSADFFPEIVEEFEYREGLFWGPVGRDFEVDGERQAVPGVFLFGGHVLAPRR